MNHHSISFINEVVAPLLYQIREHSERKAFYIDDEFYSYGEFGHYVSGIRRSLRGEGVVGDKVGLVINNDIQTYASIFALWFEGMSYVPLHPNWPLERCLDIVEQVGLRLILDSSFTSRYSDIPLVQTSGMTDDRMVMVDAVDVPDSELSYILFTSGSTGRPKGVQISRQNVAAFLNSFWQTGISISEDDRCLQCFDLSFDVSVQSYLVALTRGACVYTVPYGQMKFLSVAGLIDENRITFGAMAPSTLRYLQPYFEELDFSDFRQCIITAEAGHLDLVQDWLKYAPNTTVYDFYGPTEGTVYATFYRVKNDGTDKTYNGIISIGKPLANVTGMILDEDGRKVGLGEKGELCIAGPQVTPGYWKNEEKNKEAFSEIEYEGAPLRIYHTGDLCYQDADGDIMYSGRIDNQAKIQGFRVELSEIEFHAHTSLEGKNVVCVAYQNEKKLDEIALFIESAPMDTDELIRYLRSKMPQYMIPARYIFLDAFPINQNGKIDRKAIKSMIG
ncbi:MAG: amino acid adenylation domain-containing protein [Bacteroidales bacterium]|nr:amino acid adenylation domain-containing protein [Bacteroidales bacterium]